MAKKDKKMTAAEKSSAKKTSTNRAVIDKLIWIGIVVVLLVAAVINHKYQTVSFAIRVAAFIILLIVLALPAFLTTQGKRFWKFALDARMELRKVIWPNRQETMRITAFVSLLVVLTALFMWGVDSLLLWLIGFVTG